jgi:rod shape determining protein RodA
LIAGAIAAMFMCQVFVNIGVAIGIMPVTGIPLPLMSFGGSSVVVTLMAVGLLQSIYVQARLTSKSRADLLR